MAGVYMIRCAATGERYIGGTTLPFDVRFARWRTMLGRGKGPSALQLAWDDYSDTFEFVALKEFPPEEVHARELEAIEKLKPTLNTYLPTGAVRAISRVAQHDVGNGRRMTVREITREFGLSADLIYERCRQGLIGTDLIAPKYKAPRKAYTRRT